MKPRALIFIALGVIVAAILLALLRPPADSSSPPPVISQSPTGPAVPIAEPQLPEPLANSYDFVVKGGERVAGPLTMQAREGEDVSIKVTSDRADELHVHGYDLHTPVKAEEPAVLFFKATHSGRFEVELHKAGLQLGALEVLPK